jgi:hypothetical protein
MRQSGMLWATARPDRAVASGDSHGPTDIVALIRYTAETPTPTSASFSDDI